MGGDAPVAVVTGASAGIGLALTERLLAEGWAVEALSRRPPEIGSAPAAGLLHHRAVDLADAAALATVCEDLAQSGERLDGLVHCAGLVVRGSIAEVGVDGLESQFVVNVRAPYALTSALLPRLRSGAGSVVFVNSTQGLMAGGDAVGYAATKHGLKALADGLRAEESGSGVRVCTVYPGRTDTEGQRGIFSYEGRPYTPELLIKASTVADIIFNVLTLPAEAEMTDLTIRTSRRA